MSELEQFYNLGIYQFIGSDGSLGLKSGNYYEICNIFKSVTDETITVRIKKSENNYIFCPYSNINCFSKNWRKIDILKELETYKKIAEKLAKKLAGTIKYDYMFETICSDIPEFYECGQEGIYKTNRINCFKCLLDWARKEVEKDER